MKALTDLIKRFQRGYSDVVGVDVGSTVTKAVRLRTVNRTPTVVAVDVVSSGALPDAATGPVVPLELPKALRARYAALTYSGPGALVKLLTFPGHSEKSTDTQVNELMGLADSPEYRVAYEVVSENRTETRALAVAMPDAATSRLCALFPSGTPAPCSIEIAGLASMTAFERGVGRQHAEDAVAVIDFGNTGSTVALYNKRTLALIRKFDVGMASILKRVQETLGVDAEVAMGILADGSFDISQALHQTLESFLQQFVISRDFVERRENCHVVKLYACGATGALNVWAQEVQTASGLEPVFWNPFEGLAVAPGAIPDALKGQESQFASALGAAWAVLRQD